MKKKLLKRSLYLSALFFCGLGVISCSNDDDDDLNDESTIVAAEAGTEPEFICTELSGNEDVAESRGALLKYQKWTTGQTVRIRFISGTSAQIALVKKYINEWAQYVNLNFVYVTSSADITIRLATSNGRTFSGWSYMGTDCKSFNPSTYMCITTANETYSRNIILHEFGHALGLIHEHQSPASTISWNKSAVYSYYRTTFGWSTSDVDYNIFYKYSSSQTNYTSFDRSSIMLYQYPASFTTNKVSTPFNSQLSSTDKSFMGRQYPFLSNTKGFYRYYIPGTGGYKHFYTSNFEELRLYGLEGRMGRIYNSKVANTYPIYRYFNRATGDRLSTTSWNELKGGTSTWRYEGISGYAYKSKVSNTKPVYRYYRTSSGGEHFFTTNYNELKGGNSAWKYEGIAFYIL